MIRRTAAALVVALATAPLLAAPPQGGAAKPKPSAILAAVQGVWKMTMVNGQDAAAIGQNITITIKDNTYVQTANGQMTERGTFTIDESKKPMTIDITVVEGDDAGQKQLGVFELDGTTMRGKLADTGVVVRPTNFEPADGFFVFVMVKQK
jgi:uncharacterized protein (TIGR03067 family)